MRRIHDYYTFNRYVCEVYNNIMDLKPFKKVILFIMICLAVAIYIWAKLHVFIEKYDIDHIRDKFQHSQWVMPHNIRTINDEELNQAVADNIIRFDKAETIKVQNPPVGKFIIALSLITFGNPYIVYPLIYLVTALLFAWVVYDISKNTKLVAIAVALFLAEPLIGLQVGTTLLELPQLTITLLHIILLFIATRQKTYLRTTLSTLFAGMALGISAGVNINTIGICLMIAALWYLLVSRKTKQIPVLVVSATITYLIFSYEYLSQGFALNFSFAPGSIFLSLLAPIRIISWSQIPQFNDDWNLMRPLSLIAIITFSLQNAKTVFTITTDRIKEVLGLQLKEKKWYEDDVEEKYTLRKRVTYIWVLASSLIILYIFIPFWSRYFTILVPLGILLSVAAVDWSKLFPNKILKAISIFIASICIMLQTIFVITSVRPTVSKTALEVETHFENSTYQDLYSLIANKTEVTETRKDFWRRLTVLEQQINSRSKKVDIKVNYTPPWQDNLVAQIITTYNTPIGEFRHQSPIYFSRINNKWYFNWDDSLILPNYSRGDIITYQEYNTQGGQVLSPEGEILSEMSVVPVVYVLPRNIDINTNLSTKISELTDINISEINKRLYANHPSDMFARIGPIKNFTNMDNLNDITKNPGIRVSEESGRTYKQDIDQSTLLQIEKLIQQDKTINPTLGGKISLKKQGSQQQLTLFENQSIPGRDIQL